MSKKNMDLITLQNLSFVFQRQQFFTSIYSEKKEKKINRYIKVAKPYTILNNGKVWAIWQFSTIIKIDIVSDLKKKKIS